MSKYGETHDIFNTHHLETKAKLDALLAKNTEIEINNDGVEAKLDSIIAKNTEIDSAIDSMNAKITACDTGAVSVTSSVLATDASVASKQDTIIGHLDGVESKLDSIVSKNTEIDNAIDSMNAKIISCDTGSVSVTSSVLASGASVSSKQDEIKTLITATNTALASTLTVSAPAIVKSSSTPVNTESIYGQSVYTSSEIDMNTAKHFSLIGSSSDTANSHEVDLLVSNVSAGTFYKTSHSGYYMDGEFHMLVSHIKK